ASDGGEFWSYTLILKLVLAERSGTPSSVTVIVIKTPPDCVGVQVKTPLTGSMLAPAGAPGSSRYVSFCAGTSVSLACTVKLNGWPTEPVLFPGETMTGAVFIPPLLDPGVGSRKK